MMKTCFVTLTTAAFMLSACTQSTDKTAPENQAEPPTEMSKAAVEKSAQNTCLTAGPQTPRDIANHAGHNGDLFKMAPTSKTLNLCNIHTHTHAEHKAPGFSIAASDGVNSGYQCNETETLTASELVDPLDGKGAYKGVQPGDTIEVHWVHSSCDIEPGEHLGSCISETCTDPLLRVEAQSFLLVNDPNALDFIDYTYDGTKRANLYQPKAIPNHTGKPVVFRGSTTGTKYNNETCSPLKVTWSVRPNCAKLDINSLHRWAEQGNVFNETKSHGVRPLVTDPKLLSKID